MPQNLTISKSPPPHQSMDYNALREEGIRKIQELAGEVWTDYNLHDPGVTILEVLCYAITELGYRTNANIEDILADNTDFDTYQNQFLTAGQILPNAPLTTEDYRKLVIDLPGIRNVWLGKADREEVGLYWNEKNQTLNIEGGEKMPINGLYDVLLEFEEHESLGDLNNNIFKRTLSGGIEIEVAFPFWDEIDNMFKSEIDLEKISIKIKDNELKPFTDNLEQDYYALLEIQNKKSGKTLTSIGARIKLSGQEKELTTQEESKLKAELKKTNSSSLISTLNSRLIEVAELVENVKSLLLQYRNLCEDFFQFKAVRVQEIALDAKIEISSSADANQVLAQIFFEVYKYFSPELKFYTLEEQLAKGLSPDLIFDGPSLMHGFIDSEELKRLKNRSVIYCSDLVHLLMKVEDVVAVMDLEVSNFINNKVLDSGIRNCLKLPLSNLYKPVLSTDKSALKLERNGVIPSIDREKVEELFEELKEQHKRKRPDPKLYDIPIPTGQSQNLADYYSIQHDFPAAYGLGQDGIPKSETRERKAKALQLKGYLLFFEQILANYLTQLAHVRDLFSLDTSIKNTYFVQTLEDVPEVCMLVGSFVKILKKKKVDFENSSRIEREWEAFLKAQQDDLHKEIQKATEEKATFLDRRNRFLEHLLGRYGEDLGEYSRLATLVEEKSKSVIEDKISLLAEYPNFSSNRGQAYNYYLLNEKKLPDVWNTQNVSGFEKRVSALLGIDNYHRRWLSGDATNYMFRYQEEDDDNIDEFRYRIVDGRGQILLSSPWKFMDEEECAKQQQEVVKYGGTRTRYKHKKGKDGRYYFNLVNDNNKIIARRIEPFDSASEAKAEISKVVQFFRDQKEYQEGFYLIENVLLRPKHPSNKTSPSQLLSVDIDYSNLVKPVPINPYSFCVTLIFPGWSKKLAQPEFRMYAERVIRSEIPAHIFPEIYWLDRSTFEKFEDTYLDWLNVNTLYHQPGSKTKASEWDDATETLTNLINQIRSDLEND